MAPKTAAPLPLWRDLSSHMPSEIGRLGDDSRITIPIELRRAAGWDDKTSQLDLIAVLVEEGRVDLRIASDLDDALNERARSLSMTSERDAQKLQAMQDKYRPMTLPVGDGRIRLPELILIFLNPNFSETEPLFMQAAPTLVSLMSLQYRNRRVGAAK
jgi:bifunctional DNA-binding transcriptional regulator/antitoxin component of YhaV-PrlF toxin-antitoxin module